MAARPTKITTFAHQKTMTVASGQAVTVGRRVRHASADYEVQNAVLNELGIGIALETGAAGAKVRILLDGPVVPVVVGTGGATRGTLAKTIADGLTTATPLNAGANMRHVAGIFLESGVAGDQVGLIVSPRTIVEA